MTLIVDNPGYCTDPLESKKMMVDSRIPEIVLLSTNFHEDGMKCVWKRIGYTFSKPSFLCLESVLFMLFFLCDFLTCHIMRKEL